MKELKSVSLRQIIRNNRKIVIYVKEGGWLTMPNDLSWIEDVEVYTIEVPKGDIDYEE